MGVFVFVLQHPQIVLARQAVVLARFSIWGLGWTLDKKMGRIQATEKYWARQFRLVLEELGPAYIKVRGALCRVLGTPRILVLAA